MSSFTTPLRLEPLDDGRRWRLIEAFRYRIGSRRSPFVLTVPTGYVTDFASVPRVFWALWPPWGRYGKAAVLHDYLYSRVDICRMLADAVFFEAMTALQVGAVTRWALYLAVRLFGWTVYAPTRGPWVEDDR